MKDLRKTGWPAATLLGIGAIGFVLGQWIGRPVDLSAQPPREVVPASAQKPASDYSQRVAAYIHGNIAITREELGEYLIARHGHSKLPLLVNRRIIELACQEAKISVTPQEVEAAFEEDLKRLTVDRATFVKQILKQYGMTLYEWKEDNIKPQLLMTKLVKSQVKVVDEDVQRAFEAQFGEKAQCRLIVWPHGEEKIAFQKYDEIRKSEAAFDSVAKSQAIGSLAATGGRIAPIGRGAADEDKNIVEAIAFKLKPGELSELFKLPMQGQGGQAMSQGIAVLRCEGRVPPAYKDEREQKKLFAEQRDRLHKELFDQKVAKAIPPLFKKLHDDAKPLFVLKYGTTDQEVIKATEEELRIQGLKPPSEPLAPLPSDNKR